MKLKAVSGMMLTLLLIGMLTLAFNIQPVKTSNLEILFFDDFNDGVADGWTVQAGVWEVIDGEYYCFDPVLDPDPDGAISTVDNLNLLDGTIEAILRPGTKPNGFRQGIVFRYIDYHHYYEFMISREYDTVGFHMYDPEHHWHGIGVEVDYPIHSNINYTLRVEIESNTFTGFINSEEVLSWSDGNYTTGLVGLRVQGSDCYFNNFTVWSSPPAPPPPVGGKATPIDIPMNKPETPLLWIWLSTIILPLIATAAFVKHKKKKQ